MTSTIPEAPAPTAAPDFTDAEKARTLAYAARKLAERLERFGPTFIANGSEDLHEAYLLIAELPDTLEEAWTAAHTAQACGWCHAAITAAQAASGDTIHVDAGGFPWCPDGREHHPAAAVEVQD